jgi:hypothetical protein
MGTNKYKITGDGNIIGDHNLQVFHKTTSDVSKNLLDLIEKVTASQNERHELENDLRIVQGENHNAVMRTKSAGRIGYWLKNVAGEAGKAMLQEMTKSGIDWVKTIVAEAEVVS